MAKNTGKDKSLSEKLKSFLGFREHTPLNFDHLKTEPYHINVETIKDILPENPVNLRLKTLKEELCEVVMTKRLEDNAVETLYVKTEDMVQPHHSLETRHIVLQFYCCIIQGQLEKMTIMRSVFFRLVRNHNIAEDASMRLELLKTLSENGKNITYFEEEIGPFLLNWCPEMLSSGKGAEFLPLVVNIIKHNAAYLDDDIVAGFLRHTCSHCGKTNVEEDIQLCLEVMDAVLCYSHLPSKLLQHFVFALCLTVNVEKFSQLSWKLMRNLLGTSLGHSTVYTLCLFLQDKKNEKIPAVLRGAVFFIGMALWGSKKVESLMHSPSTVLPSFRKALDYNNSNVAFEVALSVQRLIKKNGDQLPIFTWEIILDIIEILLKYPELQQPHVPIYPLATCVHDLITTIEECSMPYCNDRLYSIIESCSDKRDETSVIRLINHRVQYIHPIKDDFIPNIKHLLEKYFKNEKRQAVQLKVLQVLRNIRVTNGHFFQDDVIDETLLRYMSHVDAISDASVRKGVIELLLEIAETCITKRYFDILDIVEKVMVLRDFQPENINPSGKRKIACADLEAAVSGLIRLFEKKLHMLPSSHCVRIYTMLVNHILLQYREIIYSDETTKIRRMIIDFFLKIRTNSKRQVGILVDGHVEYSVYVLCSTKEILIESSTSATASPAPSSSTTFSFFPLTLCFEEMFQALINALKQEKDWIILDLLLRELPKLLQNKALVISGNCNINTLCVTLCTLVNDKSFGYPENLYNAPPRFTRTEFHSQVFPVIASLAAYHSQLESHMQSMLIRCLQSGLVSRSAKICIEGLTLCTLEMRHMMVKLMPSVLLKLSQISATVSVSVAMLEFLSNLIRLPPLYVSFVEDQYRSIFAIALPYTNPHKFNQYTVALAHHVIAMWFLKCRIPFRKEFAKYITKGLCSNMSLPFDDIHGNSSVTRNESGDTNSSNVTDEAVVTLHSELLEIGLDLMARFTFGMSSNAPKRSAVADFLLEKGQKSNWVIGNKIITVTTSGCGTKAFKYGLCERCYSSCREVCDSMGSDDGESAFNTTPEPAEQPSRERRRHRSAFHRRNTTLSEKLQSTRYTKDDILLHQEKSKVQQYFARRNTSYTAAEVSEPIPDILDDAPLDDGKKNCNYQLCSCWCSGWAEIYMRRPTGNTSWMIKMQNHLFLPTSSPNIPLPAISSLLLPYKAEDSTTAQPKDNTENGLHCENVNYEEDLMNSDCPLEKDTNSSATSEALMCPKPKVPLRRTNSSPDMNSGWLGYNHEISARQKPSLQSSVTLEEQLVLDSGNGEIFHFEEKDDDKQGVERLSETMCIRPNKSDQQKTKTSPRFDFSQHSAIKGLTSGGGFESANESSQVSSAFRGRGHTISVMSPSRSATSGILPSSQRNRDMHRSGMSPSFVFLQLYHNSFFGPSTLKPLLLRQTEQNNRSINVIDHIHPYDTHKIGVLYVGEGQMDDEQAILSNVYGSVRYVDFLRGLGNLVRLSDVDQELTYVGGLDLKGEDGKFALVWHDDVMRVAFHVATLMPNKKDDVKRNNKKRHVGNNFVTIVYNESNEDYNINTIKSQCTRACVIIRPEDCNSNVVTTKVKSNDLMEIFGHSDAYIVSDESLPIFVRQMALHANLASLILDPRQQSAHVSNWLARLRAIKRLRAKILDELKPKGESPKTQIGSKFFIDDFTDYV